MRVHNIPLQGVETPNRLVLGKLHRAFAGPFRVSDASDILDMPREGTRKLLAYLASRGWLSRVRHGLYATIPLETSNVEAWFADPWVVAAKTFPPCYIGGWTALHHWELTEQLFRPVVVFSTKRVRSKERLIQGTTFRIRQLKEGQLFGTKPVWRDRERVQLSDPERTLVDTLDHPEIGGGIRHVADCLEEHLRSDGARPLKLIEYASRLNHRAVFKRLGYLLEARTLGHEEIAAACASKMSSGLSALDPSSSSKGRVLKRWRLRLNARM